MRQMAARCRMRIRTAYDGENPVVFAIGFDEQRVVESCGAALQ